MGRGGAEPRTGGRADRCGSRRRGVGEAVSVEARRVTPCDVCEIVVSNVVLAVPADTVLRVWAPH